MSDTRASLSPLHEAVAEVARIAGATAQRWFRTGVDVELKGDGSPVTVADRSAEQAARDWIASRFPDDGIMGEEFDAVRPDAARQWIIDPIDGTKAFVRGVPLWGALVACCEGELVLAGAAHYPVLDELISAAPGEGCWWNGARAQVSSVSNLSKATALITDERFPGQDERGARWRDLAAACGVVRTWGDCYGYLLVATGRAEIMVDDIVNPWDAAALKPIVEEAGGVFTDWRGTATAFGGDLIATNSALAETTRAWLGATS